MRTLTLVAATAGLVLLPSAAYAGEAVAPDAVGAPARLSAYCDGAFTATATNNNATIVFTAAAVSNGGVSTSVRCEVRSAWGTVGRAELAAPGPAVAVVGTASVPFYAGPFQLCVSASAVFPDSSTASLPTICNSL